MQVQKVNLKWGNGVDMPEKGDKVRVDWIVWKCDYERPDNDYKGERILEKDQNDYVFVVGRGDVIEGMYLPDI
ncbi:MAG: hypothetical protein M1840_000613 [Geoglossum simile]|nr:MAG: hypothetical protein M1840_000613 [Geoglossum simile]